jgi:MFS family permease
VTAFRRFSMNNKNPSIFYGWWVVLAAAVGLFWGPPIVVYCFSVFLKPLMHDFHAGRSAVSLGFTLGSLAGAISVPLAGRLIDRFGARRVILPATAMFGCALLLARILSAASVWQLYLFCVSLGVLLSGVGPVPYGSVISYWFDRHRGLALGFMMLEIGLGAMITPPVAERLIANFGWRNSYAILGSAVLLISMPLVASLLKEKPQDLGLLPDGAPCAGSATDGESVAPGLTGNAAWHSRTFWRMACAFFLVSASTQGCVVHMVAMLTDRGITVRTAALGSSLLGAAVLIGRVGTGYLLDRLFAPYLAGVLFGAAAVGIGLLCISHATGVALVGAFLVGLGLGAELDIIAYLVSRYFGLRSFGEIYGSAISAFLVAGALGPLVMGAGFDLTGSYRTPLAALFTSTLIATALMTRLGPYRYHAHQPNSKEQIFKLREASG